jgi:hypothetical protein
LVNDILCGLLGGCIGIFIGYQAFQIRDSIRKISDSVLEKKESSPSVTSGNPNLRREIDSSVVIEPKSPQQVDYEEAEELKHMNPGRFS